MLKAIITIRNIDGRFRPGEAEEALRSIAEYSTAGLYIVGSVALKIASQDYYQIVLEAYSDDLKSLLKALQAVEGAFEGTIVETSIA